jgi:5'-3' exoribonuclease 2
MYENVTKYIDRLVAAVRPRRLLFLAIDGVAPRAKMNQQRSRRFRAAQEVKEKKEMKETIIKDMLALGYDPPEPESDPWDSNVITPGTSFMANISHYLRFYILRKINSNEGIWRGLTVVLSDASEPGEGEHKIMSFIRNQRNQKGYDPNQHHVLHGLDADLIMLALATHEARFTVLREKVTFGRKDKVKFLFLLYLFLMISIDLFLVLLLNYIDFFFKF